MVALESLYFPWWQLRGKPPGRGCIYNPHINTVSYVPCSLGPAIFLVPLLSCRAHTVFDVIQKWILLHRPHLRQTYLLTDDHHKLGLKPMDCFLWVTFPKLHYKTGLKCYQWIVIAYGLFFPDPSIVILPTHTQQCNTHSQTDTHAHTQAHIHRTHTSHLYRGMYFWVIFNQINVNLFFFFRRIHEGVTLRIWSLKLSWWLLLTSVLRNGSFVKCSPWNMIWPLNSWAHHSQAYLL